MKRKKKETNVEKKGKKEHEENWILRLREKLRLIFA